MRLFNQVMQNDRLPVRFVIHMAQRQRAVHADSSGKVR